MASLGTLPRPTLWEESETGEEALVAAAIRLHEWVQTNLQRLIEGDVPLPGSDEEHYRQIIEAYLTLYQRGL